jgi:hypothetical protein
LCRWLSRLPAVVTQPAQVAGVETKANSMALKVRLDVPTVAR